MSLFSFLVMLSKDYCGNKAIKSEIKQIQTSIFSRLFFRSFYLVMKLKNQLLR